MKGTRGILLTIVFFLFSVVVVQAQKNFSADADEAFEMNRYFDAINLYKKAYSKVGKNRIEKKRILFQIAECYRLTNDLRKAESGYKRAERAGYPDPILYLHYADNLKMQEKYDEAEIQYKKYQQKVPDDPRGANGVKSCKLAQDWKDNPTRYEVSVDKKTNSRDDDFSPAYAEKKYTEVVFTSTRPDALGGKVDPNTGQSFSDLFVIKQDRRQNWGTPQLFDEEYVNSIYNEGSVAFNRKFNTIYFTRCVVEKKMKLGCAIYFSTKRGRAWGEPEVIPLASDSFTVGHPAISRNEKELIFASDIPGGYGGKDLWVAKRSRKNRPFDKPENLGPEVNTTGDEMFPTLRYYEEEGVRKMALYFASNGHIGMGGLDIFKCSRKGAGWSEPVNMMYPINSAADDFGITFNENERYLRKNEWEEAGFFTSNRKGGRGGDDIWEFILPEIIFTLEGTIKDEKTLKLLNNVTIQLKGSDGTVLTTKTDERGFYSFNRTQIHKETSYDLTASLDGYFSNSGKETTVGRNKSEKLILDLELKPIPPDPIPLPEINFDVAKWDLKPQYQDSLNDLLNQMKKNPTIVIELAAHTDFRDDEVRNDTLSFRRAKSCVQYLIDSGGIDPRRIVPKGYGERQPRVLKDGYTFGNYKYKSWNFKGVSFSPGTVLSEDYINSLRTTKEKEAAHQLNRRVTFQILHDNFVPESTNDSVSTGGLEITLNPTDNEIDLINSSEKNITAECILINTPLVFKFVPDQDTMTISMEQTRKFLDIHKITKDDFVKGADAFDEEGNVKENSIVIFKVMVITNKKVTNIPAKVVTEQDEPIQIGDEWMSEFGGYEFDTEEKKLIIY